MRDYQYVTHWFKIFLTVKDLTPDDLGSELSIIFHEDATPVGEHDGAYKRPCMNELCVVSNNLELVYPPIIVKHRARQLPYGRPMLDIIHNCHPIYNRLYFVLIYPNGGQDWSRNMYRTNGNGRVN